MSAAQAQTSSPPTPPSEPPAVLVEEDIPQWKTDWLAWKGMSKQEQHYGDYVMRLVPTEFELRPRMQNRMPVLRLTGNFVDLQFAKKEVLDSSAILAGWSRTQGVRGRLAGDVNTLPESSLNMSGELFRTWEGKHSHDVAGKYDISLGPAWDIQNRNAALNLSSSQEWRGNFLNLFGFNQLHWLMQTSEQISFRLQGTSDSSQRRFNFSYDIILGLQHEFNWMFFGKMAEFKLIYGPEFLGDQSRHFQAKPRLRLNVRY